MHGEANARTDWRLLGPMLLAVLALAGCTSAEPSAFTPPPQPKAAVSQVTASLDLPLAGRSGVLDAAGQTQAVSFFDAYRDGGRGPLLAVVTAPGRGAASAIAASLQTLATRRGLPAGSLVVSAASGSPGTIALRYTDFVAKAPGCEPEVVLSHGWANAVSPNLGCAIESSISAMVAHPRDLIAPAPFESADGARLGRAVDLYRQGKATQAEVNRNDTFQASDVGSSTGGGTK